MSKIALAGNSLGSGTLTIAAPNTSTDRTINLPDSNGTILTTATAGVPVNGPAFSAALSSNQTVSAGVFTKILFNTVNFDTNSNFLTSRFTPTLPGYYQVNAAMRVPSAGDPIVSIYKNGNIVQRGSYTTANTYNTVVTALVYCNGSTDYIEAYGYSSGTTFMGIPSETTMSGFLARSAT